MNVMDNSPIDVPVVGRLVKEEYAAGQLADCCLYALPSNVNTIATEGKKVFEELLASMGEKQLLNKYDFEILEKLPVLDNHPMLLNAIKEEQCQFIMSLYTPSKAGKQYLLLKTEQERLYSDIPMIIYTSERISKHSVNELLKDFALDTPEVFCDGVKEAVKSEKFWKNYFVSIASDMFHPTFGMRASLPKIREALKIDGIITHQKKSEMIDRMMENINKYRRNRDEEAEAELNYVLSSLDIESLKQVLTKMSKKQLETFCKTINPKILAQESTMTLEIKYIGEVDTNNRADGMYRLFLHKNYDQIHVHFGRREAFILYLIYIIDKHEHDKVDSLNIENYRTEFNSLYHAVYGQDEGDSRFDKLIGRGKDENGNLMPPQIKHCYSDIRMAVSDGCEKLRELPAPFILADANDHLYVLKNKLSIPSTLIALSI